MIQKPIHYEMLEKLYLSAPTHVSNIAFWKLVDFMKTGNTYFTEKDGYNHLYIIHDRKLFFYYSWREEKGEFIENTKEIIFSEEDLLSYDFVMLNSTQYELLDFEHPKVNESNPFIYTGNKVPVSESVRSDFEIVPFDFNQDFQEAADMINRCYAGYSYTARKVKQMTVSTAFDPDLWIWIVEKETGKRAALGIGDFFEPINEGTLDWVQVNPDFHKRGIGMLLVESLISAILKKNGTIRVTGIADEFYKKCNLISIEKWYVLDNRK